MKNTIKVERAHERASRYLLNDHASNYNMLLKTASMSALYLSRLQYIIVEVYKSVCGMNPPFIENVFQQRNTKLKTASMSEFFVFIMIAIYYS